MWLPRLFRDHNVTTITTTGHSLGGGLATICAFGAADLLKQMWDSDEWSRLRASEKWKTTVSSQGACTFQAQSVAASICANTSAAFGNSSAWTAQSRSLWTCSTYPCNRVVCLPMRLLEPVLLAHL
jgi:hypothetical protein